MTDIIEQYEGAEVIQPDEAQRMLARIRVRSATLKMTEYGCELSPDTEGNEIHFVKLDDTTGVQVEPGKGWLTVSHYFITFEGDKYKVDTDGPFHLEITGLPGAIEEAKS